MAIYSRGTSWRARRKFGRVIYVVLYNVSTCPPAIHGREYNNESAALIYLWTIIRANFIRYYPSTCLARLDRRVFFKTSRIPISRERRFFIRLTISNNSLAPRSPAPEDVRACGVKSWIYIQGAEIVVGRLKKHINAPKLIETGKLCFFFLENSSRFFATLLYGDNENQAWCRFIYPWNRICIINEGIIAFHYLKHFGASAAGNRRLSRIQWMNLFAGPLTPARFVVVVDVPVTRPLFLLICSQLNLNNLGFSDDKREHHRCILNWNYVKARCIWNYLWDVVFFFYLDAFPESP